MCTWIYIIFTTVQYLETNNIHGVFIPGGRAVAAEPPPDLPAHGR